MTDAKQGPTPTSERDAKVVEWARNNPYSPLRAIGDHYGISRERVRQILARNAIGSAHVEVLPVHYKAAVRALREHGTPLDLEAAQLIELAHISKPRRQHSRRKLVS